MTYRIVYTVIPLLLVALAVFSVYSVVKDPRVDTEIVTITDGNKTEEEEKNGASITVNSPEISHLVDGKVTWKVYAGKINSDTGTGDTYLENSRGIFYREKNNREVRFEFEAPLTIYNSITKEVRASKGVEGKLIPEMVSMSANNMEWNEEAGQLVAETIILETKITRIKGKKMILRPDDKKIRITGGVDAAFEMGDAN